MIHWHEIANMSIATSGAPAGNDYFWARGTGERLGKIRYFCGCVLVSGDVGRLQHQPRQGNDALPGIVEAKPCYSEGFLRFRDTTENYRMDLAHSKPVIQ